MIGVLVGSTFHDQFGSYTVVGLPEWVDESASWVQDVRTPEGHLVRMSTEALRHYLDNEEAWDL